MAAVGRLSKADRQFFTSLTTATLANPFSEGAPLIAALDPQGKCEPAEHFLRTLQPILDQQLDHMDMRGRDNRVQFATEDREHLEFAYLLQTYLRFVDDLDDLIDRQLAEGDKPVTVPFADKVLAQLERRGFEADEALRRGLVDQVVPPDQLMDAAMGLAEEIAANPPSAVGAAKRTIHENMAEHDLRRVVTQEGFALREARRLPDHAEAVTAFVEKREPKFA